jgi:hypothetical protein
MITPSGRTVTEAEERKRGKMTLIVDTYFRDSARKLLGPISLFHFLIMYKQFPFGSVIVVYYNFSGGLFTLSETLIFNYHNN